MELGKSPQTMRDLLTEEIISGFAGWLLEYRQVNPQTVFDRLRMILPLRLHPLFVGEDFKWVREIMTDLPPRDPNEIKEHKQRRFVGFDTLSTIPGLLEKRADAATDTKKKAKLLHDALLMLFLLVLAWRQRNLRECRLAPSSDGGNLFKEEIPLGSTMALPMSVRKRLKSDPRAKVWQFSFNGDETKAKRPVRAVLPRQPVPLLERYVECRAALLKPGTPDPGTLFLSDRGTALSLESIDYRVRGITSRCLGKAVYPHLVRDIHAKDWLESGRGLDDLSTNLWHVDPSFTRKAYGSLVDESYGTQGIEDWLDNKKPDSENDNDDDEE
jgi:hypothetical protein